RLPCTASGTGSCTPNIFAGVFHYGAAAYNAANNSLFYTGADSVSAKGRIAEITIPALVIDTDYAHLNRASYIQPLAEATGGLIYGVEIETGNSAHIGGLLVSGNRLYGTVYGF